MLGELVVTQLDVNPNGVDLAYPYQYKAGGAPFDPDWPTIAADGIVWACHKCTEGMGYTDPMFARYMAETDGVLRYRGGYAWPRTDSGSFYDQVMRTADLVLAKSSGAGRFVMVDVETTNGIRSWTDVEVDEGMWEVESRGGVLSPLLYGRVIKGWDLVFANWTQAPNVPGTVVRQLGGGEINGISSHGTPSVDIDYIVDKPRMDIIAGYKPSKDETMWIANLNGDLFLVGTSVMAITPWDCDNNPDIHTITGGLTGLQAVIDASVPVNDDNKAGRIRAMALAGEGTVTVAGGTVQATVSLSAADVAKVATATRQAFSDKPLRIASSGSVSVTGNAS